jgi:Glycosyltransferase family 87
VQFRKPLLVGLLVVGYAFNALLFLSLLRLGQFGYDVYAYWSVDLGHLYAQTPQALSGFGAFHYSPAVAQVFAVFHVVPWWIFLWGWTALLVATLVWLGGRWTLLLLAFPPLVLELYAGNINLLIAATIALGFRYPAVWAFVLLTKVTPGVGVLWFAFRREWRNLAIALGVTAAIVLVSFISAPALWSQWMTALFDLGGLTGGSLPIPVVVRLPIAAAVVWWGARSDRRWAVPVAATIATPVLWIGWSAWLVVLFGALPLLRDEAQETATAREEERHTAIATAG